VFRHTPYTAYTDRECCRDVCEGEEFILIFTRPWLSLSIYKNIKKTIWNSDFVGISKATFLNLYLCKLTLLQIRSHFSNSKALTVQKCTSREQISTHFPDINWKVFPLRLRRLYAVDANLLVALQVTPNCLKPPLHTSNCDRLPLFTNLGKKSRLFYFLVWGGVPSRWQPEVACSSSRDEGDYSAPDGRNLCSRPFLSK
jgi:hypothetical protein